MCKRDSYCLIMIPFLRNISILLSNFANSFRILFLWSWYTLLRCMIACPRCWLRIDLLSRTYHSRNISPLSTASKNSSFIFCASCIFPWFFSYCRWNLSHALCRSRSAHNLQNSPTIKPCGNEDIKAYFIKSMFANNFGKQVCYKMGTCVAFWHFGSKYNIEGMRGLVLWMGQTPLCYYNRWLFLKWNV